MRCLTLSLSNDSDGIQSRQLLTACPTVTGCLPPAELSHMKPKPNASAAAVMGMTKPHLLQQIRFNFNEK